MNMLFYFLRDNYQLRKSHHDEIRHETSIMYETSPFLLSSLLSMLRAKSFAVQFISCPYLTLMNESRKDETLYAKWT